MRARQRAYIAVGFNYFSCILTMTMMVMINNYCFSYARIRILFLLWLPIIGIWKTECTFVS